MNLLKIYKMDVLKIKVYVLTVDMVIIVCLCFV